MGPLVTREGVESVNVYHADEAVVADHQMAAAAGAEHFRAVFFKRDVPGGSRHFLAHHISGTEADEGLPHSYLSDALPRGVQNEIANQDGPEHLHITVNHFPNAPKNYRVCDQLSASARDTSRLFKISGCAPYDGAKDSSSI